MFDFIPSLPGWFCLIAALTIISAALAIEFIGLRKLRIEAYVTAKKYVPPELDAYATAYQWGGYQDVGDELYVREEYHVYLDANGQEHVIPVEPEMYRATEVGSKVFYLFRLGRLTGRAYAPGIELPMPDAPSDREEFH